MGRENEKLDSDLQVNYEKTGIEDHHWHFGGSPHELSLEQPIR